MEIWKIHKGESNQCWKKRISWCDCCLLHLYVSAILVFIPAALQASIRALDRGYFEFLLAIPMEYLLIQAPQLHGPALYYIQIGGTLAWLLLEAWLDYILKLDFRHIRWMVIGCCSLPGTGGMLGVAAQAGGGWRISAIILFLVMAVLTFVHPLPE